ncbi:MAG: di-heme oxidoredictase family protein [Planctomycetota bacterium]|jgi:CxxC motif-containing protein (DUF1111 family)
MRRLRSFALPAGILSGGLALAGLLPPDSPIPFPGEAGVPHRALDAEEEEAFLRGRTLFDKDFMGSDGVGPHFNADSCRACHQDPVIGGAGGVDVQVQHPALPDGSGGFRSPPETGALAQTHSRPGMLREEIPAQIAFVEERNPPTLLGLGLIESIGVAAILVHEDRDDEDGDGIAGIAHRLPDSSIGRFGWKAQVPDLESFVRDAMSNEMGITLPNDGNPFGLTADEDSRPDPELSRTELDDLVFFLRLLDFPPLGPETPETDEGERLFESVGCAKCHRPELDGVALFSDLLLHDVQPDGFEGVTDGMATSGLYRTPPLRGLRDTAPYFHDGRSETVDDAIRRHEGEADGARRAYVLLSQPQRDALLAFLATR